MLKPGRLSRRNIERMGVVDVEGPSRKTQCARRKRVIVQETEGNFFSTEKTVQFFCFGCPDLEF